MSEANQQVTLELPAPKVRAKKAAKTLTVVTDNASVPAPVAPAKANMLDMIERIMVDPNISVERVNQAFDFYQRVKADAARSAFEAALAEAKKEFGPIVKRHLVEYGEGNKKTSYKHEDLADIDKVVDPVLAKYGLTSRYRVRSAPNEPVSVTCILSHIEGHIEENTLSAGADGSGGKNGIQGIGSTIAYLQRYTKKASLGIAAARDDDARSVEANPVEPISEDQAAELRRLLEATDSEEEAFLSYAKADAIDSILAVQFAGLVKKLNQKLTAMRGGK